MDTHCQTTAQINESQHLWVHGDYVFKQAKGIAGASIDVDNIIIIIADVSNIFSVILFLNLKLYDMDTIHLVKCFEENLSVCFHT